MYESSVISPLNSTASGRINELMRVLRSQRVICKPPLVADYTPDGTYVRQQELAPAPVISPTPAFPKPWDITIRPDPPGCKFARTYAVLGGVFRSVSITLPAESTGTYTPMPASSADGDWFVFAAASLIVDEHGLTTGANAAIVYYADNESGLAEMLTACQSLDSYHIPLYKVHYAVPVAPATVGTWSVKEDIRDTPAVVVYA